MSFMNFLAFVSFWRPFVIIVTFVLVLNILYILMVEEKAKINMSNLNIILPWEFFRCV